MLALALAVGAGGASASGASNIEGIWSFNGGQIAVQPLPNGTFAGTVVAETKFAECTHPVGQQIWTGIHPQPDGSYWGYHQWYFEKASCALNPTLGPTAWRIEQAADGSRYLRACFSSPGSAQPTIAPNGSIANVTYGCVSSGLTASLNTAAISTKALKRSVTLPSADKCFSHRVFQIHLRDPRNDPLKEVLVEIRGRRLAIVRHAGAIVATINLKGLPKGRFTVKIRATTVLGHSISESRTYHTCRKKAPTGKPKKTKPRRHG